MASCHSHASIKHRRLWHPAVATHPQSIGGYGILAIATHQAVNGRQRGYGKMPYPPKSYKIVNKRNNEQNIINNPNFAALPLRSDGAAGGCEECGKVGVCA